MKVYPLDANILIKSLRTDIPCNSIKILFFLVSALYPVVLKFIIEQYQTVLPASIQDLPQRSELCSKRGKQGK
jgi:hypothetical protein